MRAKLIPDSIPVGMMNSAGTCALIPFLISPESLRNPARFWVIIGICGSSVPSLKYNPVFTVFRMNDIKIVLYLSIKIQTKEENLLFSNVSIPSKYNKAGSIFRTIRKIIPIFENEKTLSKFSLTFIISNLEMKKEIKNLKNINLEES